MRWTLTGGRTLVRASPESGAALPGFPHAWGRGTGRSAASSGQPLSPSVGVRGHAAADPGGHGDQLLHPVDAGDFRARRGGSWPGPQVTPRGRGQSRHPSPPSPLASSLLGCLRAADVADPAGPGQRFPGGESHPRAGAVGTPEDRPLSALTSDPTCRRSTSSGLAWAITLEAAGYRQAPGR